MTIYVFAPQGVVAAINSQAAYDATDPSVQHLWTAAPDGTLVGATAGARGTWVNPAPVAPTPPKVPVPDFWLLFTTAEEAQIRAAGASNQEVGVWLRRLDDQRTTSVDLSLSAVQAGLHDLEAASLLAAGRAAQIIAGTHP